MISKCRAVIITHSTKYKMWNVVHSFVHHTFCHLFDHFQHVSGFTGILSHQKKNKHEEVCDDIKSIKIMNMFNKFKYAINKELTSWKYHNCYLKSHSQPPQVWQMKFSSLVSGKLTHCCLPVASIAPLSPHSFDLSGPSPGSQFW